MKLFKKLAILTTALLLSFGLGIAATACDNGENNGVINGTDGSITDGSDSSTTEYVYRVKVRNAGGYGFKNVTVKLMDGENVVATATTHSTGYAYFSDVPVGNYSIVADGYPNGYSAQTDAHTIALTGTDADLVITPNGLLQGEAPKGTSYQLGDVVYDFTLTTVDGEKLTLSQVLEEKQLLVVNFWATWCEPCRSEFPAMSNAMIAESSAIGSTNIKYSDVVDFLAISVSDSKQDIFTDTYRIYESNKHVIDFGAVGAGDLASYFNVGLTVPQTYMIDRYGVVVFAHVGSMTEARDWTSRFDKFLGDDYEPYVWANSEIIEGGGDQTGPDMIKPTVDAPALNVVSDYLSASEDFTFSWQQKGVMPGDEEYDEYSWPWLPEEEMSGTEKRKSIRPANSYVHNSYAMLYATYTPTTSGEVLAFDYKLGTEADGDILYVLVDGIPVKQISGDRLNWQTCYVYVFDEYEVGKPHEIVFIYQKDSETTVYEDVVQLSNLRILNENEIPSDAGDNAQVFRNAATHLATGEDAKKAQFLHYVEVALNENDNYYRVDSNANGIGEDDEPILFANLLLTSPWHSSLSAWLLAYNNYFIIEGANLLSIVEDFAWEANQPTDMYGYTPVTKELRPILELMTEYVTCPQDYPKNWNGPHHENEWLELCCYYQHYGDEPYADPMKGITFNAAIELQESTKENKVANDIHLPFAMTPRGFKYKFTAEKSGIYRIYSQGDTDAYVFVVNENYEMVADYNDKLFINSWEENGEQKYDFNFDFHMEMQAGETWYFLCTNYLPQDLAGYQLFVEYVGTEYSYLTSAASYWSQNLVTSKLFIGDAIDYEYSDPAQGGDGYYHKVNEDGTLGSVIYLSMYRPTYLYQTSIASVLEAWKLLDDEGNWITGQWKGNEEDRPFYFNGTDYTMAMYKYSLSAMRNEGDLAGFVAVDQQLFEILQYYKEEGDPDNTWLMMCYYIETITCENE